MNRSTLSRTLAATLVVLALGVTGCSDDGDGDVASDASTTTAPTGSDIPDSGSNDGSGNESPPGEDRTTFGYRIDGAPGTTVDVETVADTMAGRQEMTETWSVTSGPRWSLYADWVTGGEITFSITEGEAATVEIIRGHTVDPEDPFAGLEVVEVIETVEVSAGGPVSVTLP